MQLAVIFAPIMSFLKKNWQYIAFAWLAFLFARKLVVGFSSYHYVASVDDNRATITDSVSQQYADALLSAMDRMGTDQDEITRIWNGINGNVENLKKVYNAFGSPPYSMWGKNSIWGSPLTLRGWLYAEITTENWNYWATLFSAAGIYN